MHNAYFRSLSATSCSAQLVYYFHTLSRPACLLSRILSHLLLVAFLAWNGRIGESSLRLPKSFLESPLHRWILVLIFLVITACSNAEKAALISQSELVSRINDKSAPIILDVRSSDEFNQGHVPGAINVPYDDYEAALVDLNLNKSDEVIVYCERGGRAQKVEKTLEKQGFFEVRHLEGDMSGWRNAGLIVE